MMNEKYLNLVEKWREGENNKEKYLNLVEMWREGENDQWKIAEFKRSIFTALLSNFYKISEAIAKRKKKCK